MNLELVLDKASLFVELNPVLQITFFLFGLYLLTTILWLKRIEENKKLKEEIQELNIGQNTNNEVVHSIDNSEEIENYIQ